MECLGNRLGGLMEINLTTATDFYRKSRHSTLLVELMGKWLSWESIAFARQGSRVQIPSSPPNISRGYSDKL